MLATKKFVEAKKPRGEQQQENNTGKREEGGTWGERGERGSDENERVSCSKIKWEGERGGGGVGGNAKSFESGQESNNWLKQTQLIKGGETTWRTNKTFFVLLSFLRRKCWIQKSVCWPTWHFYSIYQKTQKGLVSVSRPRSKKCRSENLYWANIGNKLSTIQLG